MKIIIAGSRTLDPEDDLVRNTVEDLLGMVEVGEVEYVTGCAKGVDQLPLIWRQAAITHNLTRIQVHEFPAQWKEYGKAGGAIRNKAMADFADVLVAVMTPGSKGTSNMIQTMLKLGKPVYVATIVKDDG